MATTEKLLEYKFPAKAENLKNVRASLREALADAGFSEEVISCVVLALGEACMNIIQHAYCDDDCGDIILEIHKKDTNLVFRLTDFAKKKSQVEEMKSRPLDEIRPGGLGCHIINEIMDEVQLLDCAPCQGNVLEMKKNLAR
ncbi:MAG: ATP-binding protein [Gammaproteobacteria bacterium]|nr:ATP-binding protein [Gammaproteobacteria bacterium]